jgi:hypothetical protein
MLSRDAWTTESNTQGNVLGHPVHLGHGTK